jgi:uncharacterized membrane protein YccC
VKRLPTFEPGDYLKEIQRFTTSQYWNSGVRITAGVFVPMLLMGYWGWLVPGIPFLLGALFAGVIDSPGPIHHRRNGMLIASCLNAATVLLTFVIRDNPYTLFAGLISIAFLYSFISIYGARASAIGTLAFVVMLLNITPDDTDSDALTTALLFGGGGLWYTVFSIVLYRLQPYRIVQQAIGEYVMTVAEYLRARGALFKGIDEMDAAYSRIMTSQVSVLNMQNQVRELLFKTRQFVGDPSPKSRSLMMMYLEASELFEETMHSYQDYRLLHTSLGDSEIVRKFYGMITRIVAELEYVGLSIQSGLVVKRTVDMRADFDEIKSLLREGEERQNGLQNNTMLLSLHATLDNLQRILGRINQISLYSRLEATHRGPQPADMTEMKTTPSFTVDLIRENFSFQSNAFRFSLRIASAVAIGYLLSMAFELSHSYWIMLTIVTILKPVYHLTKKRNFERVIGTLTGVLMGSLIIWFVKSDTALFLLMVVTMLLAYSFLRIYYLAFVVCLTTYLIITFHFLDPLQFRLLIGERLVDTLIGAVIAAIAARFIFPVWQGMNIRSAMQMAIDSNISFFKCAVENANGTSDKNAYGAAKKDAIVALTNVSDIFQQILSEPGSDKANALMHQFVIASHALTNRISALSGNSLKSSDKDHVGVSEEVVAVLTEAKHLIDDGSPTYGVRNVYPNDNIDAFSLILSVASEVRNIVDRINKETRIAAL